MAPVSRKTLDWIMLVSGDVTVPVVISWEHHAGEATSKVALLIAFFSLVVLNVVIVRAILSRRKRSGEGSSRGFILAAVGLALLAELLTSVGVFSFEPTSVAATTSISEVWPDPNQTEQIRPPRKQVRREQLLAYEINSL